MRKALLTVGVVLTTTLALAAAALAGPSKDGTKLKIGKTGQVFYSDYSNAKKPAYLPLAVTVTQFRAGSQGDLKNIKLPASAKQETPFYVTVKFRNVGRKTIKNGGYFGLVYLLDKAGDEADHISIIGDFGKCDGLAPTAFEPNATFTECGIYLLPKGQKPGQVEYHGSGKDALSSIKLIWPVK